jgi:hypothetical protein
MMRFELGFEKPEPGRALTSAATIEVPMWRWPDTTCSLHLYSDSATALLYSDSL